MNGIKAESTFLSTLSLDSFMKFPNNEASIQNLPISINIKKEVSHSDDEFYNSINPSNTLINYQIDNLMNIKTEPDSIQSMQYNNTEIFSQPLLSKIPDAENSGDLELNQLSTSFFKNESIDIKDENHYTLDSLSLTADLETSLITIKEESYGELENFKEASSDKDLAKSQNTLCDICGKNFASLSSLQRHRRGVHLRIKNFTCDICNKSFTENHYLTHHKQSIHLKIRDWKCARCDKSFSTKGHLKIHEKTVHLKIRDWKCSYCDETFGHKWHLKGHERIVHLKIRDWKCNHCNKSFATKSNLKSHSRVHSSNFSEVCDICNKSFRYLQSHKYQVHSDRTKNFKCNHCDKAFYSKTDLNRHTVIHSDVRDWKCKICEKSFKLKYNLQKHEEIHLRNGSYICANYSKSDPNL